MYVVKAEGRRRQPIYLVDRHKNKKQWWTMHPEDAIWFSSYEAALNQSKKLRFNNAEVITLREAIILSNNSFEYDEHPFSSDALGQD